MTGEEAKKILEAYIACESKKAHFECSEYNCDDDCPLLYDMGTVGEYNEAINMAIQALEQEPKWIPVSERLPEDRREVLVTAYWHETYQVMMASYFGDGLWWCVPFNNCGKRMQRLNPKAWMPLPKPYEPQESEEV